ncbi:alpha/beta-hydrolase [Aaosphaeria arxii CBS 175.79]|uniref:Alpha/beta-hydrolase n=1 Tax=Aaosphaeria arxii CBS 175.79 TaxID=1450172 RepID=A0A6A5XXD2_9PLEO|nr:alpha/beta-hydrolase [Aaosphaeria arxii CBS 175.79]KAF2017381.1 alpha/beta-hydrolase [Aaosphaeria arxii CBS 175.79]
MPFLNMEESISLFYTTNGDSSNPPILLIHGWCCDSHDWSWQIPVLTKTHYVIAYDARGHGRSTAPESASFSTQSLASDAASLLKHLGFSKDVLVMGHSQGGVVTSVFSVLHAELTKAVIIIDPPYWNSGEICDASIPTLQNADAHDWALAVYGDQPGGLTAGNVPEWMKQWYFRRVLGTPKHVVAGCVYDFYGKGDEGLGRSEVHARLVSKRACPRLVVYTEDEKAAKERALGMGELDEVIVIGDSPGHWPQSTRSEEFNGLLLNWLEKIKAT